VSACCSEAGSALRLAPFDCFQRGLATRRLPPLAIVGQRVAGPDGLWAQFSVRVQRHRLAELRFACASCTTLIACCEALAELNRGCVPDSICVLDAEALRVRLPGMPRDKWDRAVLAVAALRAALASVKRSILVSPEEA
jgi:hypothetical protein